MTGRTDQDFMQLALRLGRRGLGRTSPNPAVGAVVVKDGVIVGRGWTQPGGRPHAETEALQQAGEAARGATLYVTLEPCSHHGKTPPCTDAIIKAGIVRVVSAIEDPNPEVGGQGHQRLARAGIAVDIGVGADQARAAHAGHFRRIRDGRPHVTLKLAVSADGKVGLAGRKPVAITGPLMQAYVHRLRAMNDAILIGIGTAVADNPSLTCRLSGMAPLSPVRVVLDSRLQLPPESRLAQSARETPLGVFAGSEAQSGSGKALRDLGVEILQAKQNAEGLDLADVLHQLSARGITRVMVEGGPKVAVSMLQAGLIDEVVLLRGPGTIGEDGIDAIQGIPLDILTASPYFRETGRDNVGPDEMVLLERV